MSLATLTVNAPKLQTDVLKWAAHPEFSFEQKTLAAGDGADNVALIGTVLGQIVRGAITVAAAAMAGNTGNGVLTLAVTPNSTDAKAGVYTALCIEPAANGGKFEVSDPDGVLVGVATVGVAFDGDVKFTIADGATDFIAGDGFNVTVSVAAGSSKVVPLDLTADDGSQIAAFVALAAKTAADGGVDLPILVAARNVVLRSQGLVWPDGINATQKAVALASLESRGIVVRAS